MFWKHWRQEREEEVVIGCKGAWCAKALPLPAAQWDGNTPRFVVEGVAATARGGENTQERLHVYAETEKEALAILAALADITVYVTGDLIELIPFAEGKN